MAEKARILLSSVACVTLFLAAFAFPTGSAWRRTLRLGLLMVFAFTFGNMLAFVFEGQRLIPWMWMTAVAFYTLCVWLALYPQLLIRKRSSIGLLR